MDLSTYTSIILIFILYNLALLVSDAIILNDNLDVIGQCGADLWYNLRLNCIFHGIVVAVLGISYLFKKRTIIIYGDWVITLCSHIPTIISVHTINANCLQYITNHFPKYFFQFFV